jgi:outer membrane protein OmpA-like peptidoglycan-associated protein
LIHVHTRRGRSAAADQKLAARRGQAILEFLVKRGVVRERLDVVAHGWSQPLRPAPRGRHPRAGRPSDERIEFLLLLLGTGTASPL